MSDVAGGHPRERLSSYLDDELGVDERSAVDRHLAGCEDCRDELDALRRIARALSEESVPEPGIDLAAKIGRRLDAARPPARRRPLRFVLPATIAATLGAVGILVALQWREGRLGTPAPPPPPPRAAEVAAEPVPPAPKKESTAADEFSPMSAPETDKKDKAARRDADVKDQNRPVQPSLDRRSAEERKAAELSRARAGRWRSAGPRGRRAPRARAPQERERKRRARSGRHRGESRRASRVRGAVVGLGRAGDVGRRRRGSRGAGARQDRPRHGRHRLATRDRRRPALRARRASRPVRRGLLRVARAWRRGSRAAACARRGKGLLGHLGDARGRRGAALGLQLGQRLVGLDDPERRVGVHRVAPRRREGLALDVGVTRLLSFVVRGEGLAEREEVRGVLRP